MNATMRKYFLAPLFVAFSAGSVQAADAAKAGTGAAWPKGHYAALNNLPDWGGVWVLARGRPAPGAAAPEQPKFKGEYLARYQAWQNEVRSNNGVVRKETSNCMPPGMPNMMGTGQYPVEFLFTPGRVTTLHEAWMQTRTIFTDGRQHDPDYEGGIFGHSIGKWEGDTLVVDSVGFTTATRLAPGVPHSDQLRIVERIRRVSPEWMEIETTMTDPVVLAEPYTVTISYKHLDEPGVREYVCLENNHSGADEKGRPTMHLE